MILSLDLYLIMSLSTTLPSRKSNNECNIIFLAVPDSDNHDRFCFEDYPVAEDIP